MDNPKQRYPRSEARRLPDAPCPDCGQMSRKKITRDRGGLTNDFNPKVGVMWHCPNIICKGHDGFFAEEK